MSDEPADNSIARLEVSMVRSSESTALNRAKNESPFLSLPDKPGTRW